MSSGPGLRVCVFCASSEAATRHQRAIAAALGTALGEAGWELVFGGGTIGLMGEVARAALRSGARVTGVIPERLAGREIAFVEATELIRTDTMRQRKALMDERSDAFVVLPGGIGTLEELVEIITLKQLGYHERAIVVLDPDGFWNPLLTQLRQIVDWRLADPSLLGLWQVVPDVDGVIRALRSYRPPHVHTPDEVELESVEDDTLTG
jgi:uncharacterized protein (TIGR00730 family)